MRYCSFFIQEFASGSQLLVVRMQETERSFFIPRDLPDVGPWLEQQAAEDLKEPPTQNGDDQ